jgi:hypothetical protein
MVKQRFSYPPKIELTYDSVASAVECYWAVQIKCPTYISEFAKKKFTHEIIPNIIIKLLYTTNIYYNNTPPKIQ